MSSDHAEEVRPTDGPLMEIKVIAVSVRRCSLKGQAAVNLTVRQGLKSELSVRFWVYIRRSERRKEAGTRSVIRSDHLDVWVGRRSQPPCQRVCNGLVSLDVGEKKQETVVAC